MALASFGIYLIHDNIMIREALISDKFQWIAKFSSWKLLLIVCGVGITIFFLALCIEMTRIKLFSLLKIDKFVIKVMEKCNSMCEYLR